MRDAHLSSSIPCAPSMSSSRDRRENFFSTCRQIAHGGMAMDGCRMLHPSTLPARRTAGRATATTNCRPRRTWRSALLSPSHPRTVTTDPANTIDNDVPGQHRRASTSSSRGHESRVTSHDFRLLIMTVAPMYTFKSELHPAARRSVSRLRVRDQKDPLLSYSLSAAAPNDARSLAALVCWCLCAAADPGGSSTSHLPESP